MSSVNLDLSEVLVRQLLEQLPTERKEELFIEAVKNHLTEAKIQVMLLEQMEKLAIAEVKRILEEKSEIRDRVVSLVNEAFTTILHDDEVIKKKLVDGILSSLTKDRY